MDMYRNTVTGEVFTVDESREAYEEFEWDFRLEYDSFEDWFAEMIKKGDFEKVAQGQISNKKKRKETKDASMQVAARRQAEGHLAWLRKEPEVIRTEVPATPCVIMIKALFPQRKRKTVKRRKNKR